MAIDLRHFEQLRALRDVISELKEWNDELISKVQNLTLIIFILIVIIIVLILFLLPYWGLV